MNISNEIFMESYAFRDSDECGKFINYGVNFHHYALDEKYPDGKCFNNNCPVDLPKELEHWIPVIKAELENITDEVNNHLEDEQYQRELNAMARAYRNGKVN